MGLFELGSVCSAYQFGTLCFGLTLTGIGIYARRNGATRASFVFLIGLGILVILTALKLI